jgi:hypothetical protein
MSEKIITFVGQNFIIMRKILLIISLVALVSMTANAQTKDVRIGIKTGPTIDWVSSGSTAVKNEGVRLGLNVGLVYDHYITSHVAISSGANFNLLRMKYTFTDHRYVDDFLEKTNVAVERRLKANNIEIPLKAKFDVDVTNSLKAYVEAGGGLSFNISDLAKDSYDFYWVSSKGENYIDCTNQYRMTQVSMIFGLGAEYEINRVFSLFAQLTFDHAFTNAFIRSMEKQTGSMILNNYFGVEFGILY